LERVEQAREREIQRATLPSVTTTIERHKQAREREIVSLERFEQAKKRQRQRATLPLATTTIERHTQARERERERVSLDIFEQARKQERRRATLLSATKRIEREREMNAKEQEKFYLGATRTRKGAKGTESNCPSSDNKNRETEEVSLQRGGQARVRNQLTITVTSADRHGISKREKGRVS
jgi:hypothetical protein